MKTRQSGTRLPSTVFESRSILSVLLAVAVLFAFAFPLRTAYATRLVTIKDTLTRLKASVTTVNHTITFDLVSTWDATETVVIDFDNDFVTTGFANTEAEDYDITWEGAEKTIVASGGCAANSIEITTVDTATDTFTFTLCAGSAASAGNDTIEIEIGTNATAGAPGDDQIDNPGSTGSQLNTIAGPGADSGDFAIGITAEDQVTVTASVGASLTFTVNNTSINLGTLSTGSVSSDATNTLVVTTNATGGYAITGLGDDSNGMVNQDDAGQYIAWVADGTVTAGAEEFGAAYAGAAGHPAGDQDLVPAVTVTSRGTPISSDTTTATYKASIDGTVEPGTYRSIITYIATGSF